ncbi:MAG: hypothetical protein NTV86_03920 [Planctomycetota bacterium]|nr:hypothetical protein [Planctomycetota bacterium]
MKLEGYQQIEIAAALGVTPAAVCQWELLIGRLPTSEFSKVLNANPNAFRNVFQRRASAFCAPNPQPPAK